MARACSPAPSDLELAREFARRLGRELDSTNFDVVLYGSRARGEADAESDLDILVRLAGDDPGGTIAEGALRIACDLTLAHGVLVSVLVADRAFRERHRGFSFLEAVDRDGVRV